MFQSAILSTQMQRNLFWMASVICVVISRLTEWYNSIANCPQPIFQIFQTKLGIRKLQEPEKREENNIGDTVDEPAADIPIGEIVSQINFPMTCHPVIEEQIVEQEKPKSDLHQLRDSMKKVWKKHISEPLKKLVDRKKENPNDVNFPDFTTLPVKFDELSRDIGMEQFNKINNGKLATTDEYVFHVRLAGRESGKTLFYTNKRVIVVSSNHKIKWERMLTKVNGFPKLAMAGSDWNNVLFKQPTGCCDSLHIDYHKSKTVYSTSNPYLSSSRITNKLTLLGRRKKEKVFLIVPDQVEVVSFFQKNNLAQFPYE